MTKKKIILAVGALCLIALVGNITAIVIDVPATGFIAETVSDDWQIAWGGWADYIWRQTGATENFAVAPVFLPNGYLIKNVRFHFMDNDPSLNATMGLTRVNKYTGDHNTVYSRISSGSSSSIRYLTDYSASPNAAAALTNTGALSWHAFCSYNGTAASYSAALYRFYGITINADPWP
jgi:hypothetical protein